MPRAIWSGAISFGLLNVPVKLHSATSRKTVRFNELRASDGSRVRHKRVAEADGEDVDYDEIVKGYEISPERYVVLTREELAELDPKKTRTIDIQDFVDLDQIDPIYFDNAYYLAPDTGAAKAYRLLVEAMDSSRKVAVARFVLRNKEHLAAIRPMQGVLAMATMRFADEVVEPEAIAEEMPEVESEPSEAELKMARELIDSLAGDFDPDRYDDEYRKELLSMLERKAAGEEVVTQPDAEEAPTAAPDLMAALEQSLAAVKDHDTKAGKANGGGAAKKRKASKTKPGSAKKPGARGGAGKGGSRKKDSSRSS